MDKLMPIIEWLKANHGLVAEAILASIAALSLVAKLTPTDKDDFIVSKIDEYVRKILGFIGLQPKDKN